MLKFPHETKKIIADVLSNTAFKDSNIFYFSSVEEAKNNEIWNSTELILCSGNPLEFTNSEKLYNNIPLMVITDKDIEIGMHPSMLSNIPNFLPIKEVTSFVLEKCIYNTIEKVKIKNELKEVKHMREELEQKEEKFREIFNNSSFGMYEIDSEGNFILANDVYLNLLGLNKFDELKKINAFEKGFSTNGNRNKIKETLNNGEHTNFEDQILNVNNQKLFIKENIRVKKNINGEPEGFYGIVENITEKKENEKTTEKIFNHSIDLLCIAGFDGYFKVLNPAFERTLGWSKEELLSKPFIDFVLEEDKEITRNVEKVIVNGQEVFQFNNRYVCKDGSIKWLSWNAFPYPKDDIMFAIARDITQERERENNLLKLSRVTEQSPISIVITDLDGNIEYVNPKFTEVTGYTSKEIIGKNPRILKSGQQSREHYENLWKTILAGKTWQGEFSNRTKDGTTYWEKAIISPIINSSGKITHFTALKEDITERKAIEYELIQSKKEAEKADRLKSDFLTQISHEIRTPVSSLLNFASLIKSDLGDNLSDDLINSFNSIEVAGARLTRTIDLMIKISELHTDNYEAFFENHDITEVIEELFNFYKPIAEKKNLKINFINSIGSVNLFFDKLTITDALSNIIDNAIKFTKEGSVKIHLKKSFLNQISISIEDTGIGISGEYLKTIFKPFSQETSGYTRKFDGNGLGLTLVKEYCNLNNAELFVSSEKYRGSNFTLVFK